MKADKEGFLHREQAPKRIKLKREAWREIPPDSPWKLSELLEGSL